MSAIPTGLIPAAASPLVDDVPTVTQPIAPTRISTAIGEPPWMRRLLIAGAMVFLSLFHTCGYIVPRQKGL